MKKLFENWRKHLNEAEYVPGRAVGGPREPDQPAPQRKKPMADPLGRLNAFEVGEVGGYVPVEKQKELIILVGDFGIKEYEKVFEDHEDDKKGANIKLILSKEDQEWHAGSRYEYKPGSVVKQYLLTYSTPDGKYVEQPVDMYRREDEPFIGAINRWEDYFEAGGGSGEN